DQNIVEDRQNGGRAVNPLESEGNIYQHSAQRIERDQNGLSPKFSADLGTDDLDIADREGPQNVAVLKTADDLRRCAGCGGEAVEAGDHAVGSAVAIIEQRTRELVVAVTRVHGETERIALREEGGE